MDDRARDDEVARLFEQLRDAAPDERRARLDAMHLAPEIRERLRTLLESFMQVELSGPQPAGVSLTLFAKAPDSVGGEAVAPDEVDAPFVPPQQVKEYRVGDALGSGSSGHVRLGHHVKLGTKVALKFFIRSQRDPRVVERALEEGRTLAKLKHRAIASVIDIDLSESNLCLIMEYVEGESLAETLSHRQLPRATALHFAIEICDALALVHANDIVHSDLKPANVMRISDDAIKIVDFGNARPLQPRSSSESIPTGASESTGWGTFNYASPEQWKGEPFTGATDVWAVACILFECLTRQKAFPNGALVAQPVASRRDLARSLGKPIARALTACWRENPSERPTAARVRSLLLDVLDTSRRRKRRSVAAALAALGLFVLFLLLRAMSPTSARWEMNALVLETTLPGYEPRYEDDAAPGPGGTRAIRVLPGTLGLFNCVVALTASPDGSQSRLVLVDWLGRGRQQFAADGVGVGLPPDSRWLEILPHNEPGGRRYVFAPARSVLGPASGVELFAYTRGRLHPLRAWHNDGHLEEFPSFDVDDDGYPEQVVFGWNHLLEDGSGKQGRSVAYVFDAERAEAARTEPMPLDLADPASLRSGVELALSFPKDRFAPGGSSRCVNFRRDGTDAIVVSCFGESVGRAVTYRLSLVRGQVLGCTAVSPTDSYSEWILTKGHSDAEIEAEMLRLQTAVLQLAAGGWQEVPSIGPPR